MIVKIYTVSLANLAFPWIFRHLIITTTYFFQTDSQYIDLIIRPKQYIIICPKCGALTVKIVFMPYTIISNNVQLRKQKVPTTSHRNCKVQCIGYGACWETKIFLLPYISKIRVLNKVKKKYLNAEACHFEWLL